MDHRNRVSFDGLVFVPEGTQEQLAAPRLVLPDDVQLSLFKDFREAAKNDHGFKLKVKIPGDDRRIGIVLSRVGRTSAYALLAYAVEDQVRHIHGLVALLPKIDAAEDRRTIDEIRKHKVISGIDPEAFGYTLQRAGPVSATFYADIRSANYPPLPSVIGAMSAAFFSLLGVGSPADARDRLPERRTRDVPEC